VLTRWFNEGTVETPEAKYLDIILYRWEPIVTFLIGPEWVHCTG